MSTPGYFERLHARRDGVPSEYTWVATSTQKRKDRRNQRKTAAKAMLSSTRRKLEKAARNG
jgi:hypothetical protein